MTKSKIFLLFFALYSLSFVPAKKELSELRIFNRCILLIKEQYVDQKRLNPEKMLIASLDAIEKQVPELVVEAPVRGKLKVQVGAESKIFLIQDMKSLWDFSFKMRGILRFIEPHLSSQSKLEEIEYAAVNGALSQLDPHSILLEPKYSKEMKLSTKGEFGGLGIVIGIRDGVLTVISPLDGTPAFRAGIKALDQIVKIDEASTINLPLDEAVDKLRGKPGSSVSVTIQPKLKASARTISVIRDIIKVDSIKSELISNQIAYVKIKAFHGKTSQDLSEAIEAMEKKSGGGLKGLILDFRNNPGGLLNESVSVSDLFLDGGLVVVTQGIQGSKRDEEKATPGLEKTKLPMVVLVNSGSASASEIVAGALKNRNRALLIGEQTFGKGSVQMLYDFPDKSALKLTIAQYLTPGDESIQSVGITPDMMVLPAYIEDKNNLLLFPQTATREGDLDLHLDDKNRVMQRKPAYELTYVSERLSQEKQEERALSSAFYEDFEIRLAKRVLLQGNGATRQALLENAKALLPKVEQEENHKLQVGLEKLGIDWSMPNELPKKSKLEFHVVGKALAKAGEGLKVSIEVKNAGKEPVYQLYGISKAETPFLTDREFVFGRLNPGEKRVFKLEIEIPKDILTRRDLMRVYFNGNKGQEQGSLRIPVLLMGLPKPVLAYRYEIDPIKLGQKTGIRVQVKNIGSGVSEEPVVLLKNKGDSDVFIDQGRQKLKSLKPGQSVETELLFTERSEDIKTELQIQLYDGVSGEFWVEDLDLKPRKSPWKTPPQIRWLFQADVPIASKDSYRIQAEVTGRPDLKDVYLFVNDQKVLYQALKGSLKKLLLNQLIKLKPGLNLVTLVARSDETYAQRETLAIFSEAEDPLAKNP